MDINFFSAWLNDLLDPKSFKDYCVNGLCVEANTRVTRVVTGVSFRDCLIDAAIEDGADCIIVHHPNGFWKNEDRVPVGRFGARMRKLFNNGINLYGYHLPWMAIWKWEIMFKLPRRWGLATFRDSCRKVKRPLA